VTSYNHTHVTCAAGQLPMRNMPPEALQKGRFSEKSDVWSFGVLLLTMGIILFFTLTSDEKVVEHVCGVGKLS
jgi:serine/threonine protein kinase